MTSILRPGVRRCGAYEHQSPSERRRLQFALLVARYPSQYAALEVLRPHDPSGHCSIDKVKRWISSTAGFARPVPAWAITALQDDLGVTSVRPEPAVDPDIIAGIRKATADYRGQVAEMRAARKRSA